jgi:branched-chain amino acid transport system substrate-binding protein
MQHNASYKETFMTTSPSRRSVLTRSAALVGAASSSLLLPELAQAQSGKIRVGLMLPYSGAFAPLGVAIENGVRMAINEQGGKLGGREIEWFKVDDESDPSKGIENANKLVQRDKVDVLIGTVHSGVQMGIQKVARDSGVLSLIPNAGVHAATRALCAPNVFRTSFSNSQPTLALGQAMVAKGHKKAVWITWKYAAGDEAFEGFKESYTKAGGTIVKELGLPFPNVEFQALLTEIAALKPDAVACFFAGPSGVRFWLLNRRRVASGRTRSRRRHDHPSLQRFFGHTSQQIFPLGIRQGIQNATRRLCCSRLRHGLAVGARRQCRQR